MLLVQTDGQLLFPCTLLQAIFPPNFRLLVLKRGVSTFYISVKIPIPTLDALIYL